MSSGQNVKSDSQNGDQNVKSDLEPAAWLYSVGAGDNYFVTREPDRGAAEYWEPLVRVSDVRDLLDDPEKSPRGQLWYACDDPMCGFGSFPSDYDGDEGDNCPETRCDGVVVRTRLVVEHDLRRRLDETAGKMEQNFGDDDNGA